MHVVLLVCAINYVKNSALTRALHCMRVNAMHLCASGSPVCKLRTARTQQVMGPPRGLQHPPRFRDRFPLVQTLSSCGDERNNQLMLEDTNPDTWTAIVRVWLCSARRRRSTNSETDFSNDVMDELCETQIPHLLLVRKTFYSRACVKKF